MWQERQIVTIGTLVWITAGLWFWIWPSVALALWQGWAAGLWLLAAALVGRALGVLAYNRLSFWHHGVRMVYDAGSLIRVPWRSSWAALTLYATLDGLIIGMGVATGLPQGRWWMALITMGSAVVITNVTVLLYNHVVVPFYGGWQWQEERGIHRVRISRLVPNQTRLLFATLAYSWVIVVLVILIVTMGVVFTLISPALPKGFFSLGVVVFSAFVVAIAGFLLAVLVGWWFYWGAMCYNRWGPRHGLALDVKIAEVQL